MIAQSLLLLGLSALCQAKVQFLVSLTTNLGLGWNKTDHIPRVLVSRVVTLAAKSMAPVPLVLPSFPWGEMEEAAMGPVR